MKFKYIIIFISFFVLVISCDVENLLKTSDPPQVSDIFSNAPGFIVQPTQTSKFWVTASNPEEGVLTYEWSANGGEYIGSRQNDTLTWKAPVTGGLYTITVKVSNSEKDITRSREITVPSLNAPQVNIISPKSGEFFVQESNVLINATAISENGISRTDLFVNDSLVSSLSGSSSNNYQFSWIVREDAGPAEIKVSAVAKQTGLTGSDSVLVNVEGIIPGKFDAGK